MRKNTRKTRRMKRRSYKKGGATLQKKTNNLDMYKKHVNKIPDKDKDNLYNVTKYILMTIDKATNDKLLVKSDKLKFFSYVMVCILNDKCPLGENLSKFPVEKRKLAIIGIKKHVDQKRSLTFRTRGGKSRKSKRSKRSRKSRKKVKA